MKWLQLSICLIFGASLLHAATPVSDADKLRGLLGPYTKPLKPFKPTEATNQDAVALGRMLFYESRLSGNQQISCNSCHDLSKYGTGGAHAVAQKEAGTLHRDVPSVFNKASLVLFDWDGEYKTLAAKTAGAFTSANEMGIADTDLIVQRLKKVAGYAPLFQKAFPKDSDPLNLENTVAALVLFQQGLVTPAPIDDFLLGDDKALTPDQLKGGFLFDVNNCSTCHTGTMFGGQMMQKFGVTRPWPNQKDLGHYHVSKDPSHKMVFRVPTLRNVAETAPYFHDASSRRLWDAIRKMGQHEIGRHISVQDVLSMQEFLKSLTGEPLGAYVKQPTLPE